ncbi:hypothetical protein [Chondromyces apiculatus]|uniref:Uncharacterized protein n=1 Tax=Chondromyces apiculatus DSM 436 TaxID=1192034 RepID=A0A017SYH8_9BACT|nr:hypothetical protein [Chondromyces apiculatus]EYF01832.1 Hypothetical protein CAP_7785 [Chondromyces apiculatus DSM 436]
MAREGRVGYGSDRTGATLAVVVLRTAMVDERGVTAQPRAGPR